MTPRRPVRNATRPARWRSPRWKTIGILENGKLNAVEMLHEVANLFVKRNGCVIRAVYSKSNASAPAPSETLAQAAAEVDFLITGLGD